MHLCGAADRRRRSLRQPDMPHLARRHEPGHRANRLLDRHLWIDAVLVIEIDGLDLEPAEAGIAAPANIGRIAAHSKKLSV